MLKQYIYTPGRGWCYKTINYWDKVCRREVVHRQPQQLPAIAERQSSTDQHLKLFLSSLTGTTPNPTTTKRIAFVLALQGAQETGTQEGKPKRGKRLSTEYKISHPPQRSRKS